MTRTAALGMTTWRASFALIAAVLLPASLSFQFPTLPFFNTKSAPTTFGQGSKNGNLLETKQELLSAVSFTANGKNASPSTQAKVLSLVRELETARPFRSLRNEEELAKLDGTWFLQYTSPSSIENEEQLIDEWKPVDPIEYGIDRRDRVIETKQFEAKGSISAVGIEVDTSERVVAQIFDMSELRVANEINFDWGKLTVRGPFEVSEKVENRAIVSFEELVIDPNRAPTLNLGFIFSAIKSLKGSDVGGWLETTYLDEEIRIGRGNKGTMFVLTRDRDAVKS